jgi:hypothetical protein
MFTNINSVNDIQVSSNVGFLYIFDASHYNNNLSLELENVVKLGMTKLNIKTRLLQYNFEPKNISYIQCSEPSKRERILKSYIKEKLNLKPICGSEYFKVCRKEIEQVILFFALCDIDIINKYYNLYNNLKEKLGWFETIKVTDKLIKLNCAKHLDLSTERIVKLMCDTCISYYINKGQEGLVEWFLNYACRNDNNEIAIECIDKENKIFRYENKNGYLIDINGEQLINLLKECITEFKKSKSYNEAVLDILS